MKSLPRSTAKDVFYYVLMIIALYVSVFSFITLWFQYVNVKFPDVLTFGYEPSLEMIRGAMAWLVVVWPVFLLTSWLIGRERQADGGKNELGLRKGLLYLTLFVTAATIVADLITLVRYFLNGEVTTRFFLKVTVAFIVALAVFGYFHFELRREVKTKTRLPSVAAVIATVAIMASIVVGFVLVGSPAQQRLVRLDSQRVDNLSMLQNEITYYYQQKQELPATLDDLSNSLNAFIPPVDPVSGTSYEYTLTDDLTFELCANFDAPSYGFTSGMMTSTMMGGRPMMVGAYNQSWQHDVGRTCFSRTIDPDLYPEIK